MPMLVEPKCIPPLDPDFRPASLTNRQFRKNVADSCGGVPLVIGLERSDGSISRYEMQVFPESHSQAGGNFFCIERIFKFLLWQRGGWKAWIGGPASIGEYIKNCYASGGAREFDCHFMGRDVYERPFTVISCTPSDVPVERETGRSLGRHLNGCRIGFDLGASDRKASAVIDGRAVFSEEVAWQPRSQSDPEYHYREIMNALKKAASKMPRVDAIGGSAAGIYVDNKVRVASLFRGVPKDQYDKIRNLFLRIRDEMGVPFEIVNDGDITALAGSISLEDNGVLGIALGSSEAAGYVTLEGKISGWLNELAFAPVDYNPDAPVDEWSGDRGCGALYFSQQCIFHLAPKAEIEIPANLTDTEKLRFVQEKLEAGDEKSRRVGQSIAAASLPEIETVASEGINTGN